jgi:hypothetical protein
MIESRCLADDRTAGVVEYNGTFQVAQQTN